MSEQQLVSIQALVDLLSRRQPALLEQIRARHPAYIDMLQPGKLLGSNDLGQERLLADLLATTVSEAKQESAVTYQLVSRRLKTSARLRLGSSLVTATSSGGLVAALIHDRPKHALVAGILAFASSGFLLVSQYLEEYAGGQNSLREMRDRVVRHIAESAEVEGEFRLMEIRGTFDEAVPLIRKLSGVVASIREIQLAVT